MPKVPNLNHPEVMTHSKRSLTVLKVVFAALTLAVGTSAFAQRQCIDNFKPRGTGTESWAPRGVEKPVEDWNTEAGFRATLLDSEKMGQVATYFDRKLDTRIFYTSTGMADRNGKVPLVDPEAQAVVIFFHGSGTSQSGGINFVHNMNKLANLGYAAMSFDMPFHGEGPTRDQFNDSAYFIKWVDSVVALARQSGKPVYLVGHSFGPDVIAEYLYTYPNGVQGAALLSPAAFNKTLEDWYQKRTAHMKFGGEVPQNTLGGQWAYRVARGFKWNRSGGVGDPTIANPNLRVEILSGDREEYVPAPVGGKNRTPIGRNTYDVKRALQPYFANANIVIEPGVGHYLFDHEDSAGQNVVARTVYAMLGFDYSKENEATRQTAAKRSGRPYWVQLDRMIDTDRLFKSWLKSKGLEGLARSLVNAANNPQAQKLMDEFRLELRARAATVSRK